MALRHEERRIQLGGARNCRDLGGLPTVDGRETRQGQVFRSDSLHACSRADLDALSAAGIHVVYDLRRPSEVEELPGPLPYVHRHIRSRDVSDSDFPSMRDTIDGERWLYDDYVGMLRTAASDFGDLFTRLAAPDGLPALFHCRGGKDRTGLAAALLLLVLGVDRDVVLDDYELTGQWDGPENKPEVIEAFADLGMSRAAAAGMLSTPRWAMSDALELLEDQYGGAESYLLGPAEMQSTTIEQLRKTLTY